MIIQPTVAFVAGRSGGHLLPAITLAHEHKQRNPLGKVLLFSTDTNLDATITTSTKVHDYYVPLAVDNVPQKLLGYPAFIAQCVWALCTSMYYLYRYKPTSVTSLGGYISLPVCLAAWLLRIPIHLFELNVVPGKAVHFLLPLATKIHICFEETRQHIASNHQPKCTLQPYPLRFTTHDLALSKHAACKQLGIASEKYTLFVTGGSQGSLSINKLVQQWVVEHTHLRHDITIIHQTGHHPSIDWKSFYQQHGIDAIVFEYDNNVVPYYRAADLVLCRAGAGTLFEILFFKVPCITIPLETKSTAHQVDNAQAMARNYPYLFTIFYQKDTIASPTKFFECITTHLIMYVKKGGYSVSLDQQNN
ncbi:MAG TPA: UDP-N-acetylglucosamine--N-acetylmuramyl-(pentapeptide) pyrophosphoryl-undecaprenol N-acetylglucosamine transferase [Candidatus Limnocylindria bacterium]|nr:UDP-N-acetylglucosamine--N-acetylmuramyl-(pentapeptide) pyrophosphoryl-undecaprenol N-acetylglucosamine transferase [Candidatus Limnocylindria bacterium]